MANLTGSRSNFPQNVDVIRELTDLPANKKVQAQRYQFLKTKEVLSPSEVTELNNLTTELQDYLITAESMNMFGDVVISTQKFFKENVMDFVLDKKQEFQAEVDKLNNRGDYNPSVQYFKNNFVFYNDGAINHVYLCLEDCTGKKPSTNPLFWRKLSIQGAKGEAGLNFVFQGVWDNSVIYAKNSAVQHGGILFASLVDNNIDNLPDLTQDTDYWAKALDVTITVKKLIGVRNLVSQANTINFMTGEIVAFNKDIDSLEVYQNSVRLTKGVHYNIGLDGQSITKVEGSWDATVLNPIFFEFVVTRNQIGNDLIFSDGQSVTDGTITRNKLDVDTQAEINKVDSIATKVGNGALTTTAQDIVGAINEHEGDISSINSQLAQDVQDLVSHKAETVSKVVLVTEPYNQVTNTTVNLGFRPKSVNILASILSTKYESNGQSDGVSQYAIYSIADTGDKSIVGGTVVRFNKETTNNNYLSGGITFTDTGIEITWGMVGGSFGVSGNRRLIISAITHGGV